MTEKPIVKLKTVVIADCSTCRSGESIQSKPSPSGLYRIVGCSKCDTWALGLNEPIAIRHWNVCEATKAANNLLNRG